jgi:hypothetical protein
VYDLPVVKKKEQRRPAFTGGEVTQLVARTRQPKYRMLNVLCASWDVVPERECCPDRPKVPLCCTLLESIFRNATQDSSEVDSLLQLWRWYILSDAQVSPGRRVTQSVEMFLRSSPRASPSRNPLAMNS